MAFHGPYRAVRGTVRIPVWHGELGRHRWALVDAADYGLAMRRRWRIGSDGYPVATVWDADKKDSVAIALHRLIARAPAGLQVDHRWHDVLDCRRRALRVATASQNSANTRRFKPHLSKYRGVTIHKQTGKYQAAAKHQDRCIYLGLFSNEEDAALAYNKKARE